MTEEDEAFEELSRKQGDWGMHGSRKHQILRYVENVKSKGTSMTDKEAMAKALEFLEDNQHHIVDHERHAYLMLYNDCITALKERLAEHAMRKVQRLGQEIEQETALQTLHSENERLGLYKDAYGQPEQEPTQCKPLTEEFGIVGYADVGQHSIQVMFKDRRNADRFKAAHGIKENT
jgi:hypothetical protein